MELAQKILDSPHVQLALLILLSLVVIAIGARIIRGMVRRNPETREHRRRMLLHRDGRLGDGFVTDANETTIYYAYSVQGVQYETSQDVTLLRDKLPEQPQRLIGLTNLKYAMSNPGNSILLCEEWSGLRAPAALSTDAMLASESDDRVPAASHTSMSQAESNPLQ